MERRVVSDLRVRGAQRYEAGHKRRAGNEHDARPLARRLSARSVAACAHRPIRCQVLIRDLTGKSDAIALARVRMQC
jgi:hypothetical protein